MIDSVAGAMIEPMPTPSKEPTRRTWVKLLLGSNVVNSASVTPTIVSPNATISLEPMRRTIRGEFGATIIITVA